jgi:hypothetical protein
MGTYSDYVSLTTAGAVTEITGTISVPGGAKLIAIDVTFVETDALPGIVRLDCAGIKTPQRYVLPNGSTTIAVAYGGSLHRDIDVTIPGNVNTLTVGLQSLAAAATAVIVGVTWIA